MRKLKLCVSKKDAGMRLLQFLKRNHLKASSVKSIKRAINHKYCTVNGQIETFSSRLLKADDVVEIHLGAFEEKIPKQWDIPILFEDSDFCMIHKPAGLTSDPQLIRRHFPRNVELVHRLDKETSGILILAKKKEARRKIVQLFKEQKVHKLYLALVDGLIKEEEGKIDNYLGKKHSYQGQTIYGVVDKKHGKHAVTDWKCLKRGKMASLLACEPYTGRTHQLRVHFSHIGHPILGDSQYGKQFRCLFHPQRNLLHAYRLCFIHPWTGKEIQVTAPLPDDFKQAIFKLFGCYKMSFP